MSTSRKVEFEYTDIIEIFVAIRQSSIFSLLSQKKCKELLTSATIREVVEAGRTVPRRSPPRDLYIVGEGQVDIYMPDKDKPIGHVMPGQSLELATLWNGSKDWQYTWRAAKQTTLLKVAFSEIDAALAESPRLYSYLKKVAVHVELQKLKNDLRLFGFRPEDVHLVFERLDLVDDIGLCEIRDPFFVVPHFGELSLAFDLGMGRRKTKHLVVGDFASVVDGTNGRTKVSANDGSGYWVIRENAFAGEVFEQNWNTFLQAADPFASERITPDAASDSMRRARSRLTPASEPDNGLGIELFYAAPNAALAKKHRTRRPKVVKQNDKMDCGAACMSMIARHYGKNLSLPFIRGYLHVTRDGASLLSLERAAALLGFEAIGAMANMKNLTELHLPMILLMKGHYVVLFEIKDEMATIGDPATGLRKLPLAQLDEEFSRNVLLIRPTEKLYELPDSQASAWKYLQLFRGHHHEMWQLTLLTVLTFFFGLVLPISNQIVIDTVLIGQQYDLVTVLVASMIGLAIFDALSSWVRGYLNAHFTTRLDSKFSALFLGHAYKLPLAYHAVRNVGDFTSRMGELAKIRSFIADRPVSILMDVINVLIYGLVIFLYGPILLLLVLGAIVVMSALTLVFTPRLTRLTNEQFLLGAKSSSLLFELTRSLETVRAIRGVLAARWRCESVANEGVALSFKAQRLNAIISSVNSVVHTVFNQSLWLVSVYLFLNKELTLGQVIAVSALSGQVLGPAMSLITGWTGFQQFKHSVARVDDIFTAPPETSSAVEATKQPKRLEGAVEFRNVSFRYGSETSPLVLQGLNLKIEPGQTIAFVGRSGSGKSTLGQMVNLLYQPTKGDVFFDGVDFKDLPLSNLRRQIGMIMQESNMFSGSILDNITLGDPSPSFQRAMEAARLADAHDFVKDLSSGYSTRIGEGGTSLSGGQRQRLAIARALYQDPPILIMDEATSALDAISERAIVNNLKARQGKRTTIVIAHRLNTIASADRIFVLDQGELLESGSHKELLSARGSYYGLFRQQLAG